MSALLGLLGLSALPALLGGLGPLALLGGPAGVIVAWAGSVAANKTIKTVAIVGGLAVLVIVTAAVAVHLERLAADSVAYKIMAAEQTSLGLKYDCPSRAPHERPLAACLAARERDLADAAARKLDEMRRVAARAQDALDRADRRLSDRQLELDRFIAAARARGEDGPVPQLMLDAWARERRARGVK